MNAKRGIYLAIILSLTIVLFSVIKYSGFVINTTPSRVSIDQGFIVLANTFDGSTTDFLRMNDSELASIENLTLERTNYGKIVFSQVINLTQDAVNNIIDLDSNINISNNFIKINTATLTSLEKPATLYLYGLNFSNPRILRNSEVCPASICQEIDYSGGTLIFTTTQFSNYSAEETPLAEEVPPVLGGGGGGAVVKKTNFTISKDLIKISLKQGESAREVIEVANTGDYALNISLDAGNLKKFMAISEDSFYLEKGKVRTINIDIFAKENEIPDAYIGRIVVKGDGTEKIINVIIEVKEKKPLFDIKVDVLNKIVSKGDNVKANISITNFGDLRDMDILLYVAIKDFDNNVITFKDESLAIDKELSLIRELKIPEDVLFGQYVFYSRVSYGNISASGTDVFEVKTKETPSLKFLVNKTTIIVLIIIVIIILSILLIKLRKIKKVSKRIMRSKAR